MLNAASVERGADGRAVLRLRFCSVYARRRNGWRLVSGQLIRAGAD